MKVHAVSFNSYKVLKTELHPYMFIPEKKDSQKLRKNIGLTAAICAMAAVGLTLFNLLKK